MAAWDPPARPEPAAGETASSQQARRPGPRSAARALTSQHGVRFLSFSTIGAAVFVLGLALQAFLVQLCHLGSDLSYLIQGIVSVQVSFLANYFWTWRDTSSAFWPACGRFNAQKILTSVLNLLFYAALVAAGLNYLVANIATTAAFTAINYIVGNYWTFTPRKGK